MKIIYDKNPNYILRILRGEEAVEKILSFAQEREIEAAWVSGLGAADKIEISYYDFATREYIKKIIDEECELLNLTGNIAYADGKQMLHAHVTLSTKDYSIIGGHLHSMQISGTGEIHVTKLDAKFEREFDEETGLKLLTGK